MGAAVNFCTLRSLFELLTTVVIFNVAITNNLIKHSLIRIGIGDTVPTSFLTCILDKQTTQRMRNVLLVGKGRDHNVDAQW